jgi:hypothetical protein
MKTRMMVQLLAAMAMTTGLSISSPARADECKRVDFGVKNNFKVKIKALKMEYLFDEDGAVRTESFADSEVDAGAFKTIAKDQNLAGGEGNHLKLLRLHFKAWCGGKWTRELVGEDDSAFDGTKVCKSNSNRSYRYDTNDADICNNL